MSLKFGIYLVEQRIVTPEQFCGLVKIQQDNTSSLASIALRKNMLTIRQVANLLEAVEKDPDSSFQRIAVQRGYLRPTEVEYLQQIQQATCQSIRSLVVECKLLTGQQCSVLFMHYEKTVAVQQRAAYPAEVHGKLGTKKAASKTPAQKQTVATSPSPQKPQPAKPAKPANPRQPNFKRRPVIIEKNVEV